MRAATISKGKADRETGDATEDGLSEISDTRGASRDAPSMTLIRLNHRDVAGCCDLEPCGFEAVWANNSRKSDSSSLVKFRSAAASSNSAAI